MPNRFMTRMTANPLATRGPCMTQNWPLGWVPASTQNESTAFPDSANDKWRTTPAASLPSLSDDDIDPAIDRRASSASSSHNNQVAFREERTSYGRQDWLAQSRMTQQTKQGKFWLSSLFEGTRPASSRAADTTDRRAGFQTFDQGGGWSKNVSFAVWTPAHRSRTDL
jgi:hypothetical protein